MTGAALRDGADEAVELPGAHCSLWWRNTPPMPGERVGAIGHFAANTPEAAKAVLDEACRVLRSKGCTLAVGPMDGNTWRRYRLLTERGGRPAFLLELDNPDAWPLWWRSAGFGALATYSSTVNAALDRPDPRLARAAERIEAAGVVIRPFDASRLDEELKLAFSVALRSFRHNFLYRPIEEAEFLEQSRGLGPLLSQGLSALALHGTDPVGLIFAMPDLLQARRGEPVTDYLIKTLAVVPGRAYAGLGTVLMSHIRERARSRGITRAIHALMHDSNHSTNVNAETTRTIRRYTLFSRRLA
ncbi:MAG: GNAT family N-acetyltransferase [Elusimicrobia bacterium]|nr:GNAT family N-acetyltransferase [Elusimicrobiota bacterium]